MNLTKRERAILQLAKQGLSDYKIARKIKTDPPSVTRSRKNAYEKLIWAATDLEWASKTGISISGFEQLAQSSAVFNYFL